MLEQEYSISVSDINNTVFISMLPILNASTKIKVIKSTNNHSRKKIIILK